MGYKASIITIQKPSEKLNDEDLLGKLGFDKITFLGDTTFDESMYPNDKTLNIGYYNDCLIILDDYQLTTSLELTKSPELLSSYENRLTNIFPESEILTVACHSSVNYHLYSLIKNAQKLRFKRVSHEQPLIEFGDRVKEENEVYAYSKIIDGQRMFKSTYNDNEIYDNTEDQMMEDFTFGVAKRHLGVMISTNEDEELMNDIVFKKYRVNFRDEKSSSTTKSSSTIKKDKTNWKTYVIILIVIILWQIIKRFVFKN